MKSIVYRHSWITRLTHWVNALALVILFMSGLQIFNAYPSLHWGHKAEPEEAFFSISAKEEGGEIIGYVRFYDWSMKTTGFLGIQNTPMGPFPRAFPSWLTIPGFFWLAGGRRWHFFFAWLFVLNGLLYLLYNAVSGNLRRLFFAPKDQVREYNLVQKTAYVGVLFILTPLIILSGLAMSPQLNVAFNWLPEMFGGRQSARTFHFLATFLFLLFTFGHIVMVAVSGVVNNMRSMITGWHTQEIFESEAEPYETEKRSEDTEVTLRKEDDENGET